MEGLLDTLNHRQSAVEEIIFVDERDLNNYEKGSRIHESTECNLVGLKGQIKAIMSLKTFINDVFSE